MTHLQSAPIVRTRTGFPIVLLGSLVMMASASLPSPFYPVLQHEIGFSAATLTAIFAVYAVFLLLTLLIAGSISDHLGRRPVLSAGFVLLAASAAIFQHADSALGLFAARGVQGIACGLLISTLSAAVVDLEPRRRPGLAAVLNSVLPLIGLAAGALVSGAAMDAVAAPKSEVFGSLAGLAVLMAVLVWTFPETSPRHVGALSSLWPRIGLPAPARAAFWRSAPALFAGWATGGLYLSLGAPIVSHVFGLEKATMQGFVVTLLAGMGALACLLAQKQSSRRITLYGTSALALGTALTLVAILAQTLPLYLVALALVGTGFGTSFFGVVRSVVPMASADSRGELFAALYVFCYLAFGIPTVIAGMLVPVFGLIATTIGYGGVVCAMAGVAWLLRSFGTAD